MSSTARRIMAETGQDCPATGLWESTCAPGVRATFYQGDIMPPCEGKAVVWELVQPGPGAVPPQC